MHGFWNGSSELTEDLNEPFQRSFEFYLTTCRRAPFLTRIAASTLDGILINLITTTATFLAGVFSNIPIGGIPFALIEALFEASFFSFLFYIVFRAICTTHFGGTPGKLMLHLRNVRAHDGGRLSFPQALGRELLQIVSIFLVVPCLMAFSHTGALLGDSMLDATVYDIREEEK